MKILDFIFPEKCGLCGQKEPEKGDLLCKNCREELPVMKHVCAIRDLTLPDDRKLSVYCALRYTGEVKKGIVSMKYGDRPQVAKFLGRELYSVLTESREFDLDLDEFDYIVPIPAAKEKINMRGYNQAELIADEFSALSGIPMLKDALIKNSNVASQSTLDFAARQKSVAGVYEACNTGAIVNKKLILIDDILTTGATVIECAKILYGSGADLVTALTASTGKKDL